MRFRSARPRKGKIRFGSARPLSRSRLDARPGKKRRLKYISLLPSFITLMNGACGFMAVVFASRSPELRLSFPLIRSFNMNSFVVASCMIFLAMLADVMDGRVARLTRTTSSFGGQLDSLSDAISFGVAPAFLMMKVAGFHMTRLGFERLRFSVAIGRGIFFAAIFYAMCALVRLARFNVENDEGESAHMNFAGLPSPAAAGIVVSLVIFFRKFIPGITGEVSEAYRSFETAAVIILPVMTFIAGMLMVSRIRYPHLANQLLRRKKPLSSLLLLFAGGILVLWNIQLAMVLGFCGFAIFGVIRRILAGLLKKRPPRQPAAD